MDLFEVIKKRRSIRSFKREPVKNEDLKLILESARLAPSGHNNQPWRFIVVRDSETKKKLSIASYNQHFIADADVVVVALGETARFKSKTSSTRVPYLQDPMIAVEHMVLAAAALGYGTCWIGAFNEAEVKQILKIPEKFVVIALLPIGVPAENPPQRPRKPFNEIFYKESFGIPLEL